MKIKSKGGRYLLARGVLLAGVVISVILSLVIYRWETARRHSEFLLKASDRVNAIKDEIEDSVETLYSIASFYASSQGVSREEFRVFSKNVLLRHPDILALAWIPLVPDSERTVYEGAARSFYVDFQFKEASAQNKLVEAGQRDAYFPIYYIEPFDKNSLIFGLDIASDPVRRQAMEKARDTGALSATGRINLIRPEGGYGCRVFLPIYHNEFSLGTAEERHMGLAGFASVILEIKRTVELALGSMKAAGIDIYLYDESAAKPNERFLYYHASRLSDRREEILSLDEDPEVSFTSGFTVGDRDWSFSCIATKEFLDTHPIWFCWAVFGFGLFFTVILAVYLLSLASRAARIEKLVEERTEQLAQTKEELERKNKELEKLDALKSEFVSIVSHELRTPLSITKEGISLVLDGIPGEINKEQERVLFTARDNIDRLARIINELLDISRIEAGRIELKRELVDIREVIKNAVLPFEAKLKEKGVELKLLLPQEALFVYLDADKMGQVFTNLISNAFKFTKQGFIEFRLEDKKESLECVISDTGIGISQEDLPKAFGKFQQFNRTVGPGEKGTGLGLSIVKGIIEVHKGNIRVESKPGQGTKFTFSIPKYTYEMVSREYINNSIKEAKKADTRMSLVSVSLVNFDKIKQGFSAEEVRAILKDLEDALRSSLRRKGDIVVRDTGEAMVILVDCNKDNSLIVEGRLEQALESYLISKDLSPAVKVRLKAVTYPDEAKNEEEIMDIVKEG